jgi:hypothetical protein
MRDTGWEACLVRPFIEGQMVAVDQGRQYRDPICKRPSGPAFIIWSIPTKRTPADAAGKASDTDGGRHARQHVKKLGGHRAEIVRVAAMGGFNNLIDQDSSFSSSISSARSASSDCLGQL